MPRKHTNIVTPHEFKPMGLNSWDYNIEAKYEFTNIKEAIMIQFGMRVHDLCPKGPLLTVLDSIHDADCP